MTNSHPHIAFHRRWMLEAGTLERLGECAGLVKAFERTPILPEKHRQLMLTSLSKGAQATTAIEGNTLTDDEVEAVAEGKALEPSKQYQEKEVKNIIEAMNTLLREVANDGVTRPITPELVLSFHEMVASGLGEHLNAVPGTFAQAARYVAGYKAPEHEEIQALIEQLCDWLLAEFGYPDQSFSQAVIQAVVTHVYIEWIHPFDDGNGRTGRLLEFYILLRAGNPDFASHILSNFYNETRPEYYRHLRKAGQKGDLTEFIAYAVGGLRDGLLRTHRLLLGNQLEIAWQKHIYDQFADKPYMKKSVFKRKRNLMLAFPHGKLLSPVEAVELTLELRREYSQLSERTIHRDLADLVGMHLLVREKGRYRANIALLSRQLPRRLKRSPS